MPALRNSPTYTCGMSNSEQLRGVTVLRVRVCGYRLSTHDCFVGYRPLSRFVTIFSLKHLDRLRPALRSDALLFFQPHALSNRPAINAPLYDLHTYVHRSGIPPRQAPHSRNKMVCANCYKSHKSSTPATSCVSQGAKWPAR